MKEPLVGDDSMRSLSTKSHSFRFWFLWAPFLLLTLMTACQLLWAICSGGGYSPDAAIFSVMLWPSVVIGAIVAYASERRWGFIVAVAGACLGILLKPLVTSYSVCGTHYEQLITIVAIEAQNAVCGTFVLLLLASCLVGCASWIRRAIMDAH